MKVIAHRGFSTQYPENTLLAFKKAIEAGADGIETDLRLTLDNEIILFHDRNLKKYTGIETDLRLTLDNEIILFHDRNLKKYTGIDA